MGHYHFDIKKGGPGQDEWTDQDTFIISNGEAKVLYDSSAQYDFEGDYYTN